MFVSKLFFYQFKFFFQTIFDQMIILQQDNDLFEEEELLYNNGLKQVKQNLQKWFMQFKIDARQVNKFISLNYVFKPDYKDYVQNLEYLNISSDLRQIKAKFKQQQIQKSNNVFRELHNLIIKSTIKNDKIEKALINKIKQILQQSEIENQQQENFIDNILNNSSISGLKQIDVSEDLSKKKKQKIINSLLESIEYQNFLKPKSNKNILNRSLRILLKSFLYEEDHFLIQGIIKRIIQGKDFKLSVLENNRQIGLSQKNKNDLIELIRKLECFKEFSKNEQNIAQIKFEINMNLFNFLTKIQVRPISKYDIIQKYLEDPSYNVRLRRDLSIDEISKIEEYLSATKILEKYEEIFQQNKTLLDRKSKTIQLILNRVSPFLQQKDKQMLRTYLDQFRFKQFYEYWGVLAKFKEIYKYINQECPDYIQALQSKNIDLNQIMKKLKKLLKKQLENKKISFVESEKIIKNVLESTQLDSIENNKQICETVRDQLLKFIEQNEVYQNYIKIKFPEKNTEKELRKELERFLIQVDLDQRYPYNVIQIVIQNLILSKNQNIIPKIERLSSGNKKLIKMQLRVKSQNLVLWKKFKENKGIDMDNLEGKVKRVLFIELKRNMNIPYQITLQLIEKILKAKQFEETVQTYTALTEEQKKEIIKFSQKNQICLIYIHSCKNFQILQNQKNFKECITKLLEEADFDEQQIDIVTSLYLDYCYISQDLQNHPQQYIRNSIKTIKSSKNFESIDKEIKKDKTYKKYMQNFSEILKKKQQELIENFSNTVNNILYCDFEEERIEKFLNQIVKLKDGLKINVEYLLNDFRKNKKQAKLAYSKIISEESYIQIKLLEHILKVRNHLICFGEILKQVRFTIDQQDFSYLSSRQKGELLQNLSEWNFQTAVDENDKLSNYHKRKIVQAIDSKNSFANYIQILDNRNAITRQLRAFIVSYTIFCQKQHVKISNVLAKFSKTQIKVIVDKKSQIHLLTTHSYDDLISQVSLETSSHLFYDDNKLTPENFQKLKYSQFQLNLNIKKELTISFDDIQYTFYINHEKTIGDLIAEDFSDLKGKLYKIYDDKKTEISPTTIVKNLNTNLIRIIPVKKVFIENTQIIVQRNQKVSDLRKLLMCKGQIKNFVMDENILNQNRLIWEITAKRNQIQIKVDYKKLITVDSVLRDKFGSNFQIYRREGSLLCELNEVENLKGIPSGDFFEIYQNQVLSLREKTSKKLIDKLEVLQSKGQELLYTDIKQKQYFQQYKQLLLIQGNEQKFKTIDKSVMKTPLKNKLLAQIIDKVGNEYSILKKIFNELQRIKKCKV